MASSEGKRPCLASPRLPQPRIGFRLLLISPRWKSVLHPIWQIWTEYCLRSAQPKAYDDLTFTKPKSALNKIKANVEGSGTAVMFRKS